MAETIVRKPLVQYVKAFKHGHNERVGVLVADKASDGSVHIGWSRCCAKDRFNKKLGLTIASQRVSRHTHKKIPRDVAIEMANFIERCRNYYKTNDVVIT